MNDQRNLEEQTMIEVRRSVAKQNRVHVQQIKWLREAVTGPPYTSVARTDECYKGPLFPGQ
jgi:hypothetical protein